jgi:HlyD family secretion protein
LGAASTRYSDVAGGASEAEILAAENRLADAQKAYTEAEEAHRTTHDCTYIEESDSYDCVGGSEEEQEARIVAASALADLMAAQEAYDLLVAGGNTLGIATNAASVSSAQAQLDIAQAQLDALLADPTDSELASAEANLASAQANLNKLLDGPSAAQITTQEARLEQARLSLRQAEENLADATLIAPFDGLITAVNLNVGEQASGVAVQLVDINSYEVILTVDEVDIGAVSIGQPAEVTLEAWPDGVIVAEVVSIAPQAVHGANGIVSYEVYLALGETDRPLLVGMTADASLVTAQRENVLLVPNQAISANRQTGTYTVNLVNGDVTETVEVTIGLRDEGFTQITSGVSEGDQLLIGNVLPIAEQEGPGPDGNGGPFGQ